MKPIFVETLWSEANDELNTRQVWTFADFEKAAFDAAMSHTSGGYAKTKVNVMFDNGDRIEFRLDLAPHDTHGVRHHVNNYKTFAVTDRGRDICAKRPAYGEFLELLKTIEFSDETA